MESVQSYDERGWNYMAELGKFVEGGMIGNDFIDAVSGIVNRGCHDPVSKRVGFEMHGLCMPALSLTFVCRAAMRHRTS